MTARTPGEALPGSEEMARAYETAAFDETPPAHVDRAILAAARRRPRYRMASFLPPLALAATVVLSFSVVLRTTVFDRTAAPNLPAEPVAPAMEASRSERELDRAAPSDEAPEAFEPPTQASEASPARAPVRLNRSAEPGASSRAGAAPAAEREQAETLQDTAPLEELVTPANGSRIQALSPTAAPVQCDAEIRAEADSWLECIGTHLDAGSIGAASRELELFKGAYPDYPLPAELQALAAP